MRKFLATILVSIACLAVGAVGALAAPNPSETGKPGQSCVPIEEASPGSVPGKSFLSPGSPFNEAIFNTPEGGVGGQHYSPNAQYDVACYQASTH
jgi:hypothetical protein